MERLLLFPTAEEAQPLLELWPEAPCRIIGVGMAEAAAGAARAIVESGARSVVLCGIAGAMSEELVLGQVVEVVEDCVAGLPPRYSKRYESSPKTNYQAVLSLTVNHSEDGYLYCDMQPSLHLIEQMEGAAVAAVAAALGVEFLHLRAISNRVGDPFHQWQIREATQALADALKNLKTI